jgi:ABC-type maltose transport system permease subunit
MHFVLTRLFHRIIEPPATPLWGKVLLLVASGILLAPVFRPGPVVPVLVALLGPVGMFLLALSVLLRPHTRPLAVGLRIIAVVLAVLYVVGTVIYLALWNLG